MATMHPDHHLIASSDIANVNVYDKAGNNIGKIDHLMIEKGRGRVRYAVLSFGGFMGLNHSHYPLPWNAISYKSDLGGFETSVTEQKLRDAPEFSDDSWTRRDWEQSLHSYYGVPDYWSETGAGPVGAPPPVTSSVPSAGARTVASTGADLISTEDIEGIDVYDRSDNSIGTVNHLMIDKRSGQVRYAVIAFGGFLGVGQGHHPVPWDSLEYNSVLGGFYTDITDQQLRDAPEFSDDSWQRRDWEDRIRQHYGSSRQS